MSCYVVWAVKCI